MRILSLGTTFCALAMVSIMRGLSEARGSICLGLYGILAGQNRLPIPPARIVMYRLGSGFLESLIDSDKDLAWVEVIGEEVFSSHVSVIICE